MEILLKNTRRDISLYPQYRLINIHSFFLSATSSPISITDHYLKKINDTKVINKGRYKEFEMRLSKYIEEYEKLKDKTDLEVLKELLELRRNFFNTSEKNQIDIQAKKKCDFKKKEILEPIEILGINSTSNKHNCISSLDFSSELSKKMNDNMNIFIYLGDVDSVNNTINWCSNFLEKVTFIVRKERYENQVTYYDLKDHPLISDRLVIQDCIAFKQIPKKGLHIILGELNLLFNHSFKNAYGISKIEYHSGAILTNHFNTSDKSRYVISPLSSGINLLPYSPGVERNKMNLYHFNKLKLESIEENNHWIDSIYSKHYLDLINYFSVTYNKDNFSHLLKYLERPNSYREFLVNKRIMLEKYFKDIETANYSFNYLNIDTLEKETYLPEVKNTKGVLVDIIKINKISEMNVVISSNIGKGSINPRTYVESKLKKERKYFLANLLHYATDSIINLYNNLREDRVNEQILKENIYIDYQLDKKNEIETFPLYNKATFGVTSSGMIKIFRSKLGAGSICIGDSLLQWEAEDVNPCILNKKIIVFTPLLASDDFGNSELSYKKVVGKGRINIIIINNKIISIVDGEVLQPSLGVVISMDNYTADNFLKYNNITDLKNIKQDDYKQMKIKLELAPFDETVDFHNSLEKSYGGGIMLMEDGNDLFINNSSRDLELEKEGWLNPLSMQTQESQLHLPNRHPRTLLGVLDDNTSVLVTISGRTLESVGATLEESTKIIKKIFPNIDKLMNLDGGASSLIAYIEKKELFELNYPSTSNDNSSSGMCRELNSMMILDISPS